MRRAWKPPARRTVDGPPGDGVHRVSAQYRDGLQLDLAVLAEPAVRRGRAAPGFVCLHRCGPPSGTPVSGAGKPPVEAFRDADTVTAGQLREWALVARIALADADKYLRRGSVGKAHHRLPPGIQATVTGLDPAELHRAARAAATVLTRVSTLAAQRSGADLPDELARHVTARLQ